MHFISLSILLKREDNIIYSVRLTRKLRYSAQPVTGALSKQLNYLVAVTYVSVLDNALVFAKLHTTITPEEEDMIKSCRKKRFIQ